ncbi:hypothetical protein EON77_15265 [bacterium]|nr:MAG: hypothetical protein EON77_15265 [bacterium]
MPSSAYKQRRSTPYRAFLEGRASRWLKACLVVAGLDACATDAHGTPTTPATRATPTPTPTPKEAPLSPGARCVDPGTVLVVALEFPAEETGSLKEKLLFEGDERVKVHESGFTEACALRVGEGLDMDNGLVGRVTSIVRKAAKARPATNAKGAKGAKAERVVSTSERVVTRLLHVHTAKSDVDTTPEHPFFVADRGFVRAGDLKAGDVLVAQDQTATTVLETATRDVATPVSVFNMRVEGSATYYAGGLLVHNGTCNPKAVTEEAVAAASLASTSVHAEGVAQTAQATPANEETRNALVAKAKSRLRSMEFSFNIGRENAKELRAYARRTEQIRARAARIVSSFASKSFASATNASSFEAWVLSSFA